MLLIPEEPLGETQVIDDVAGEHDALCIDVTQELGQLARAGALEAKMDIRQKQRPRRTPGFGAPHEPPGLSL